MCEGVDLINWLRIGSRGGFLQTW